MTTVKKAANSAETTLAQNITSTATSFSVTDGSAFPTESFLASINDEIMFVGSRSGNSFSDIVRGIEGTAKTAHDAGDAVENRFTAGAHMQLIDAIDGVASDLVSHKSEIATQDKAGHIKLSDIPLPTIATQAEAEAGTNNTKMMTPLRTHQAIDSKVRIVDNMLELNVDGEWQIFKLVPPDDTTDAPGSKILIDGDMQAGFFGEVSASELISGTDLASLVGISQGTSQHSTAGWLKFAWQGKILFVAKKTFRNSISWDHINGANAVYGGKTVEIDGLSYKIRLLKGANNDPAGAYDGAICHGSEWNRLMLPIHQEVINKNWADPDNVENDIPVWSHNLGSGNQGMYTDEDLLTHSNHGSGSYSWCQETRKDNIAYRVLRGSGGVSYSLSSASSNTASFLGWRPCLELVP